jgi:hypothetical protein
MRRIKLVLGALAIVVTSLVAFAGPAMAQDDLNCRDARGYLIRCDGELYAPYNTSGYNPYPYYNAYPDPFYSNDAYYGDDLFYGDSLFYNEDIIEAYLEGDYQELLEEAADYYSSW